MKIYEWGRCIGSELQLQSLLPPPQVARSQPCSSSEAEKAIYNKLKGELTGELIVPGRGTTQKVTSAYGVLRLMIWIFKQISKKKNMNVLLGKAFYSKRSSHRETVDLDQPAETALRSSVWCTQDARIGT